MFQNFQVTRENKKSVCLCTLFPTAKQRQSESKPSKSIPYKNIFSNLKLHTDRFYKRYHAVIFNQKLRRTSLFILR